LVNPVSELWKWAEIRSWDKEPHSFDEWYEATRAEINKEPCAELHDEHDNSMQSACHCPSFRVKDIAHPAFAANSMVKQSRTVKQQHKRRNKRLENDLDRASNSLMANATG